MIPWFSLFLGNLVFVKLIGLEQFGKPLNLFSFLKKAFLTFFLLVLIYALSYPLAHIIASSLPYLLPLIYGLLAYGLYWSVTFFKKNYDYKIVENPGQLRLDFFYETLTAGLFFYVFSLNPTFWEGIMILLLSFFTYLFAYVLWLGIHNKIKGEIYASTARRYWSYYFSLLLLCFFFHSLSLTEAFNL